jgi:hypothetical protein
MAYKMSEVDCLSSAINAERAWYMLAFQIARSALDERFGCEHAHAAALRAIDQRLAAIYAVNPDWRPRNED